MTSSTETLGSLVDSANYTSDSTGQLLTATGSSPSESYSYDSNGNRETVTTSGGQVTCITGPNNELLYDGTYTYSYDGEGNQTARWVASSTSPLETQPGPNDTDITTYTWDNRDRLTSVTHYADYDAYTGTGDYTSPTPDMTVTYVYDAFNRWIGETVTAGGTTTQTRYVYDGNQIVMQFQKTGTGDLAATNLSHRYLWGPAVDQLMADEQLTPVVGGGYDLTSPGTTVWTLTDSENTVRDLATYSNGTTTVENHREFSAYGELLSQTNPQTGQAAAVDCVFAYTGRALDEATGLQNNDERWYEAITGRWLSQDPIGFKSGDANLDCYCRNSPIIHVDPFGLWLYPWQKGASWNPIDTIHLWTGGAIGGVAVVGGPQIEGGAIAGSSVQGSLGAGYFHKDHGQLFCSGRWAGSPKGGVSAVPNPNQNAPNNPGAVAGASVGLGGGILLTNAESVNDLLGPFTTVNINAVVGVQISYAPGPNGMIVAVSGTFGKSWGVSCSAYPTSTKAGWANPPDNDNDVDPGPSVDPLGWAPSFPGF